MAEKKKKGSKGPMVKGLFQPGQNRPGDHGPKASITRPGMKKNQQQILS